MLNLIFDYDGTLHDCIRIYAPAFRLAYEHLIVQGAAPQRFWQDAELEQWLGLPAWEMWETFAPFLPAAEKQQCSQIIGDEMLRLIQTGQARLYPKVPELLTLLNASGIRLILMSNCRRAYMQAHCRQFGLNRFFAVCYCAEDYNWISKAEIFPDIRNHFDGTFAVIGDRHQDMELARKHDLKFIGCSYGYGSFGELDSANAIVQKPEEIPDALHLVFAKQHYAS